MNAPEPRPREKTPEEKAREAKLKALVNDIYGSVLKTANEILHNCKTFPISVLQLKDPSYTEMAAHLRRLCSIIDLLVIDGDTQYTASKARDYTDFAHDVAKAIEAGDQSRLNDLIAILNRRPFT
jgi:hypothetical protein